MRATHLAAAAAAMAAVQISELPGRTVAQAIADASTEPTACSVFSCRRLDVNRGYPDPTKADEGKWTHNLTTTIANDWLSRIMGQGASFAFAGAQGVANAAITVSATSLTNTAGAFPTTGQGLQGCIVVAYGLAGAQFVYGRITTNSSTVLTIDQWYNATSTTGAAGSTPTTSGGSSATGISYVILPGGAPAEWMAITATVHTPVVGDTTLSGELTSGGFARGVGTFAHTTSGTTYTLALLWTSSTSATTIINEAQFNSATTTNAGYMPFESAEPSSPTLVSGDTLTNTATITV